MSEETKTIPKKRLTRKQLLFAKKYNDNDGNGTETALQVYNTQIEQVAANIASENIRKPQVIEAIEADLRSRQQFDDSLITEKALCSQLAEIKENSVNDMIKIKTIELTAKIKKITDAVVQDKPAKEAELHRKDIKSLSMDELTEELLSRLSLNKIRQGV